MELFKEKLTKMGYEPEVIEKIQEAAHHLSCKKYGLQWENHPESIEELLKSHEVILEEIQEREIKLGKENAPQHLLIEGDNLEALTSLQTTHKGMVDVIYIDPPYNTKNKFKYSDNYGHHSKWLSFMSKRLILAKDLMSEDGVIFISIDDNEFAQLKLLCDEVFGEQNVELMIWNKIGTGSSSEKMKQTKRFRRDHEYILVAYNNKHKAFFNKVEQKRNYKQALKNPDNDVRGVYKAGCICRSEEKSNKKSSNYFTVKSPSGKEWTRQWLVSELEFHRLNDDKRIYWGKNDEGTPSVKIFANESSEVYPSSLILEKGSAAIGSKELSDILNINKFDNPKPLPLMKHILEMSTKQNSIILDFFAGSGTTGHAVLEINKEDGGNRQFILCTNNENKICEEVTYERLKRVIGGYTTLKGKEVEGIPANLKYYKTKFLKK